MAALSAWIAVYGHVISAEKRLHVVQYRCMPAIPLNLIGIAVFSHLFNALFHNNLPPTHPTPHAGWVARISAWSIVHSTCHTGNNRPLHLESQSQRAEGCLRWCFCDMCPRLDRNRLKRYTSPACPATQVHLTSFWPLQSASPLKMLGHKCPGMPLCSTFQCSVSLSTVWTIPRKGTVPERASSSQGF